MRRFLISLLCLNSLVGPLSFAETGCKEKRAAKRTAHKALMQCLKGWMQFRPADPDPSDDCVTKTQGFIAAARESKACGQEQMQPKN